MASVHRRSPFPPGRLPLALAALALSILAGCDRKPPETTQVAARVNGDEISVHQVQSMLQRQPRLASQYGEAAASHAVHGLVEQELAAQAARKDGLDSDPQVLQALEIARREVLARAYQDKLAERAISPSSDEIDRYYDSQPALFAQRRRYLLQEFNLESLPDDPAPLEAEVAQATDAHAVESALLAKDLRFNTRQVSMLAEEMPLQVLDKVAALQPGHSLLVPRRNGALIVTLLQSEPLPVQRGPARDAIRSFLMNEKRRQLVGEGMKALRDRAKVEYVGSFAAASGKAAASEPARAPEVASGSELAAPPER